MLKQNFESSCGLYKHWEISIDFLTPPYKFNNAQSTHMHLMLHRDKKRQILKLYIVDSIALKIPTKILEQNSLDYK